MTDAQDVRIETDSMGEARVPAERYWGAQTQRSLEHFPIGGARFRFAPPLIHALGLVKWAAARANAELGVLPQDKAELIARAAREVAEGALDDEFPLVVFQTGSGTQTNMNANEVVAARANELAGAGRGGKSPVHPNDDVNRGQSSNDVFPTAMHIATVLETEDRLLPAVEGLHDTLRTKAGDFADVVMVGRTHLQDATPVTLGQVVGGWATQIDQALATVRAALPGLYELALGGTAVGTGLNTHPRFAATAARIIGEETGRPFRPAADFFAALRKVATLDGVQLVLPAHGHPFTDLMGRVDAIERHHVERLDDLARIGADIGDASVIEFSHHLFKERSWGAMAESETFAHLEHLRLAGRATSRTVDGQLHYAIEH